MNVNPSLPAPNDSFERFHAVALDLVASRLLPVVSTASTLLCNFYQITPYQNTIRELFLTHVRQKEQEYNQQHQQALLQLPPDTSLRRRFETEQELLHAELEKRFGRRYTGPTVLMKSNDTFTEDRWYEFLLHQYTLTEHQKLEARDLIFSLRFNQQLLLYGQSRDSDQDSPFKEFSYSAVRHIEKRAHEILREFELKEPLSQYGDLLKSIPSDKRKILLMNAYAKSYYAIQALISDSGPLEQLKKVIQTTHSASGLRLSARIAFFDKAAAGSTEENEFAGQIQEIQQVFTQHRAQTTKEATTLKFPEKQLTVPNKELNRLCTQFYKESLVFYRVFSNFVDLLQVHYNMDMAQLRGTSSPPLGGSPALSSSGSRARTSSLLANRASSSASISTPMQIDTPDVKLAPSITITLSGSSPRQRSSSSLLRRSSGTHSSSSLSKSSSGEFSTGTRYEPLVSEQLKSFVRIKAIFEQIYLYCPEHIRQDYDAKSHSDPSSNYFGSI